jgi:4-hydroxy-tetrahydrodipicolinate reductase
MGKLLERAAEEQGHRITAVIDPRSPETRAASGVAVSRRIDDAAALEQADVAIEFTHPQAVLENIKALSGRRLPLVVGTTGWYERLPEAERIIHHDGSRLLYAANFSLGVNLFYRIAAAAAQMLDPFPEYDVGGYEVHHRLKADSPSGTAKTLLERVIAHMRRKQRPVWGTPDRALGPEELHYASVRVGAVPGTHTLVFDSVSDAIEITHTARNRDGFVAGALRGAQWLAGAGAGIFTIDDMMEDFL